MARLWNALKPAVGASAPWSGIALPGTIASPNTITLPPQLQPVSDEISISPAPTIFNEAPVLTPERDAGVLEEGSVDLLGELESSPASIEDSPLWEENEPATAFLEVGPSDDIKASQGVELPQFSWKPSLFSTGSDPFVIGAPESAVPVSKSAPVVEPKNAAEALEYPRIARHRKGMTADPVQGPVSPVVVEGIMERLLQRTAADVHPWLYLSPPLDDAGLSREKIDEVVQGVIEGLLVHCGEVCVLELDGPADGSSPTVGPGWNEVLLGRVDCQAAMREGRKPGIWRFPSGSASTRGGPWFAARSIQGVVRELRERFPLVVVSSPTGLATPMGRLWTTQCQGWTWVVSAKTWETTLLEETARAFTKGMPPWIGCVLVEE